MNTSVDTKGTERFNPNVGSVVNENLNLWERCPVLNFTTYLD